MSRSRRRGIVPPVRAGAPGRRIVALLATVAVAGLTSVGCTATAAGPSSSAAPASVSVSVSDSPLPTAAPADADAVIASLGRVPLPTVAPSATAPVTAGPGHPQVLAMGEPVRVRIGGGEGLITALGPVELTGYDGNGRAPRDTAATITVQLQPTAGTLTATAGEFTSRDETGRVVPLAARGPATVSATAPAGRTLTLAGRYESGSAQVTWRHQGHVLAVWVFTVELD